jgi:hypothetical protein
VTMSGARLTGLRSRRRVSSGVWAAFLVFLVLISGCGRTPTKWEKLRPAVYPARGRIIVDGSPMAGVIVHFESVEYPLTASGVSDQNGNFALQTFAPRDGAPGGEHRVRIEKLVNKDPEALVPVIVNELPARFASTDQSGLTATVDPKGPNRFDFDVTTTRNR